MWFQREESQVGDAGATRAEVVGDAGGSDGASDSDVVGAACRTSGAVVVSLSVMVGDVIIGVSAESDVLGLDIGFCAPLIDAEHMAAQTTPLKSVKRAMNPNIA
ncbi:MAG: hypothetical protein EPN30_04360 [Actinomycetota bacterium]|nr:MAG: hypothetical protein EPN30_04360 [Actinomycetota bacterium]